MVAEKIPVSAVIITKNEEKNLPDCLKSVFFANDIVVVDSVSTDMTVKIARDSGCRVFIEEWKGDGPQKNSAVDKCKYEWVLVVDADERIPKETAHEIIRIINDLESADAYSFPRRNYFKGRWIKYCGWWPDRITRLVKKSKGRFTATVHHGKWETSGILKKVDVPIDHYSYRDYSDMIALLNPKSTNMAKELFDAGIRANIFTPFIHGIAMFIKVYIIRLGFLNGFDGFVIALTRACGTFFKYAKLLELQRLNKNS
jgi:glycosyltransferase involved in cell wall biosynthesis